MACGCIRHSQTEKDDGQSYGPRQAPGHQILISQAGGPWWSQLQQIRSHAQRQRAEATSL